MKNPHENCWADSNHYCQDVWDEAIAARDKEWVEWFEKTCHFDKSGLGSEITLHQWQSRCKEIGK